MNLSQRSRATTPAFLRWGVLVTCIWLHACSGGAETQVNEPPPPGTDTTPPTIPGTPTATAVSSTRIDLSWAASTDAVGVSGYRIYRNGSNTPLATATTTTYSDTSVAASTAYAYTLRAFDAAGNESTASGAGSATTPARTVRGSGRPGLPAIEYHVPRVGSAERGQHHFALAIHEPDIQHAHEDAAGAEQQSALVCAATARPRASIHRDEPGHRDHRARHHRPRIQRFAERSRAARHGVPSQLPHRSARVHLLHRPRHCGSSRGVHRDGRRRWRRDNQCSLRAEPADHQQAATTITTAATSHSAPTAICTWALAMAVAAAIRLKTASASRHCSARCCASGSERRARATRSQQTIPSRATRSVRQAAHVRAANCPEIYAWGFRNPWRWSFDRSNGRCGSPTWARGPMRKSTRYSVAATTAGIAAKVHTITSRPDARPVG